MTQLLPLYTAEEVGAQFNVSPETVRRWARLGRLQSVALPSGRRRFRPEDIAELRSTNSRTDVA